MISGSDNIEKISNGLKAGADDYIVKPFAIEAFLAKVVNAHQKSSLINKKLLNTDFKKIPESHTLMRAGKFVMLTSSEYKIVDAILVSDNTQKSRKELIADLSNVEITERNIDVHIHSIRKKFIKINMAIEAIRGYG